MPYYLSNGKGLITLQYKRDVKHLHEEADKKKGEIALASLGKKPQGVPNVNQE